MPVDAFVKPIEYPLGYKKAGRRTGRPARYRPIEFAAPPVFYETETMIFSDTSARSAITAPLIK
jgi:hypothetical protein